MGGGILFSVMPDMHVYTSSVFFFFSACVPEAFALSTSLFFFIRQDEVLRLLGDSTHDSLDHSHHFFFFFEVTKSNLFVCFLSNSTRIVPVRHI